MISFLNEPFRPTLSIEIHLDDHDHDRVFQTWRESHGERSIGDRRTELINDSHGR